MFASLIRTQARVWIFPWRLAAPADATDLAVIVRIFLIKDRERGRCGHIGSPRLAVAYRRRPAQDISQDPIQLTINVPSLMRWTFATPEAIQARAVLASRTDKTAAAARTERRDIWTLLCLR